MVKLKNETDGLVPEFCERLFFQAADILTDDHLALIRTVQRAENMKEGAFAGTRFPHNTDDLWGINLNFNTFQYSEIAIILIYINALYHGGILDGSEERTSETVTKS